MTLRTWLWIAPAALLAGCSQGADPPRAEADGGPSGADSSGTTAGDAADASGDGEAARRAAWCPAGWADVEARTEAALAAMTLDEKIAQMAGTRALSANGVYPTPGVERLGVPGLRMVDGPRGVTQGAGHATAFPVGMARAATWDPEIERQVGAAIAREVRAKGANVVPA